MANLAEPLELIGQLQLELNKGQSVRLSLQSALQRCHSQFSSELSRWLMQRSSGAETAPNFSSDVRNQFVQLLELGLRGGPVAESLNQLEAEMIEICREDVEAQLERLPLLMSLPLIFCFLPAFLILILGPVLNAFSL